MELEMLFDGEKIRKNEYLEDVLLPKKPEIQKKYTSGMEFGIDRSNLKKIFERSVCPEISEFKEEIKKDKEIFNTSKYFSSEKSQSNRGNEYDTSSLDMNFLMDSFSLPEDNMLESDLKEYNPEPLPQEENYENPVEENYTNINENSNIFPNVINN